MPTLVYETEGRFFVRHSVFSILKEYSVQLKVYPVEGILNDRLRSMFSFCLLAQKSVAIAKKKWFRSFGGTLL